MTHRASAAHVGASLLLIASTLTAQAQTAPAAASSGPLRALQEEATAALEDVIVTARRREEVVQDVPQSVVGISGKAIEAQNFLQFEDVAKLVPGLTLSTSQNAATIRGVSFQPTAQTNPTVSLYINDAPLQPAFVFQSLFDVGQVEVLRGPQGTFRGQSAPSGAINITTRRPDLENFGGWMSTTATNLDGRNLQGAVNLPIVSDKFAVRLAAVTDHTDNDGVKSVNSTTQPSKDTVAYRVSARLEPIDALKAVVVYQNLQNKTVGFNGGAVYGNGAPGGSIKNSGYALPFVQPAGYNGPVIPQGQLLSVEQNADLTRTRQQLLTGQVDYGFAGQKLSYVGAWSKNTSGFGTTFGDTPNMVQGDWPGRGIASDLTRRTDELRLASEERVAGFLDYVVGGFHEKEDIVNNVYNGISFQPGAFGSPLGAPLAQAPNLAYSTTTFAYVPSHLTEWSYFANLIVHLGDKAELSGGVRFINAKSDAPRANSQTAGLKAVAMTQAACTAAGGAYGATYTGVCDVPVAGQSGPPQETRYKKTPKVYNGSFSYHFTPDLMGYLSTGSSYRPAPSQVGLINGSNNPLLNSLSNLSDETSRSYEAGIKSSWLDQRLRANLAYYHQTFDGLVNSLLSPIPYVAITGVSPPFVTIQIPFNTNVKAVVDGVDFDASYAVTNNWSVSGGASWAHGRYSNALLPCLDGNFDGVPDSIFPFAPFLFPPGVLIARCRTSGSSATTPYWNATLQSEYGHPITASLDGFGGGVLTYYPSNPNSDPRYVVPSYALLNVYLGLRSPGTGWEVQVFAKNLANNRTITALGSTDVTAINSVASIFGTSGYRSISYVPRREFGLTFRYALGSH